MNLGHVQKLIDAGKLDAKGVIDQAALQAAGVARGGKDGVRLLGKGELTAKVSLQGRRRVEGRARGGREGRRLGRGDRGRDPAADMAAAKKGSVPRRPPRTRRRPP